jgi:hypothetical protein
MKTTTIIAIATSLFSQVALASQPCGNYGISTNQPNCGQPQQQPVVVYSQPQQAPCGQQVVQQTPVQAPVQNPPAYVGNRGFFRAGYQSSYGVSRYQTRRAEMNATTPDYGRGFEVGLRGAQDANTLDIGVGLYARAHQKSGQQRLAIEISADTFESGALLTQAAGMYYLNPNGFVKPFGLLGGGLELTHGDTVAQAGVGLDVEFNRFTVTGDVRAIESINGGACFDAASCSVSSSFLLGNVGIARKF